MPIKLTTTTRGWGEVKKGKKIIQKNLKNKSNHKNNKCFSWVSAVTAGSHSPSHLPRMSSNTVLISGPAMGAAQIRIWSYSYVFLPPMSTAITTSGILLWELSMTFYIFHRHRVCLVDHVDLICSLYSCWVFFLSHTAPVHLWGPGVEVVQLLGLQGFWQRQVLRGAGG